MTADQPAGPAPQPPRLDLCPNAEYVADLAAGTLQEWFHGYAPAEEGEPIGQYRVVALSTDPGDDPPVRPGARRFVGRFRFDPVGGAYRRSGRVARVWAVVELED